MKRRTIDRREVDHDDIGNSRRDDGSHIIAKPTRADKIGRPVKIRTGRERERACGRVEIEAAILDGARDHHIVCAARKDGSGDGELSGKGRVLNRGKRFPALKLRTDRRRRIFRPDGDRGDVEKAFRSLIGRITDKGQMQRGVNGG
mgnify:FL=1